MSFWRWHPNLWSARSGASAFVSEALARGQSWVGDYVRQARHIIEHQIPEKEKWARNSMRTRWAWRVITPDSRSFIGQAGFLSFVA
jgi:hypothetical protein